MWCSFHPSSSLRFSADSAAFSLPPFVSPNYAHHFLSFAFSSRTLQELTPLTTGNGPSALSSKQVLQVIDCIEGFISIRRRALGSMQLSVQEKRPGDVLRETRRDMIGRCVTIIIKTIFSAAVLPSRSVRAEFICL